MNCAQSRALLPYLIDGELPEPERLDLRAHLTACPACRREVEELEAVGRLLAELPPPEPPPGLEERLHLRLAAAAAGGGPGPEAGAVRDLRPARRPLLLLAGAAALALALALALHPGRAVHAPVASRASTASTAPTAGGVAAPGSAAGSGSASQAPAAAAAALFDLRAADPAEAAREAEARLAGLGPVARAEVLPGSQALSVRVEYARPVRAEAVRDALGPLGAVAAGTAEAAAGRAASGERAAPQLFALPSPTAAPADVLSVVVRVQAASSGAEGAP
ncbi:MAG: zf-HC2 domain-containing protein [Clostridia bacterium]|nr:zf-HC2 domain-containing protein [Clostridia bacterium]MCL6522489.1 zf-HC2 domain-containing protein [Bacillota bacterium]